jgi:general secretion pathway protein H
MIFRDRQRGFTLIELLVSILLIVITLSMVQLSVGDDKRQRQIREEGERLSTLINLAGDEAVMMGRELGLLVSEQRYQFFYLNAGQWIAYTDNPIFRERTLPQDVYFELYQQGMSVSVKEKIVVDEEVPPVPQIFILSSGERTPFELTLALKDGYSYSISAQMFGDLHHSYGGQDAHLSL